ncbi:MAG: NAD(P)(+) transhydrogenase (Re/Si-specific) subunit alpha [Rhodobiaceae bacterium]|nr:NAD(P)(+) transhydrogenase (Re/Si-specific) subunit alpha [Rhodobiaceae bacterium]MAT23225.1 NAD(P)(+) transhydrogenase (Re/Si-specific) subunit alpha [Rhodobiaceae bacterium]MDC3084800.1 Re/Si-specific NAD(P)(+) transhydrogenase subunit alpha [Gammaproteobacteria bacterium]|tara:strand:- start:3414 stop:4550 length:1137 start_codon:yes stop_codon:yes gene_type:complete
MQISVLTEHDKLETRVALSPDTVKKLVSNGLNVIIQSGCGQQSNYSDQQYENAGATVTRTISDKVLSSDILVTVKRPDDKVLAKLSKSAIVIGQMDPYVNPAEMEEYTKYGHQLFSMELMPRITRAQSMDVLSSQSNLAGYKAVIDSTAEYKKAIPMMMTAAGTIAPAKIFIMGVGVAGLQAIATARRLGGIVTATDVRPATKEQVESLGAKFIAVEDEEFKAAETAAGYAKEMSKEYQEKQTQLVSDHIKNQDIVITTALIPGRKAPILISKKMVETMKEGSVIADLATERGGNVEIAQPGKNVMHNGVTILGTENFARLLPTDASNLYAQNVMKFLDEIIDNETQQLSINYDDEIIKGILISRGGKLVHPMYQKGD